MSITNYCQISEFEQVDAEVGTTTCPYCDAKTALMRHEYTRAAVIRCDGCGKTYVTIVPYSKFLQDKEGGK